MENCRQKNIRIIKFGRKQRNTAVKLGENPIRAFTAMIFKTPSPLLQIDAQFRVVQAWTAFMLSCTAARNSVSALRREAIEWAEYAGAIPPYELRLSRHAQHEPPS
jgi:hypothetical protein